MRLRILLAVIGLGVISASGVRSLTAADHREAPLIQLDTRADINDIYIFASPADPNDVVFIMTVNPVAGVLSPETFTPGIKYEFEIYNDNDLKPDIIFKIAFKRPSDQGQIVKVRSKGTETKFRGEGEVHQTIDLGGGGHFQAGIFDDPFFMDVVAFSNDALPGGQDFYRGTNTLGIVLEVPTAELLAPPQTIIGLRGVAKKGETDSAGRPLVSRLLLPPNLRDVFNKTKPARQDPFIPALANTLLADFNPTAAQNLADFFIPDILPLDTAQPTEFFNGRGLEDDVVDDMLNVVTNGRLTSDGVDANDVAFLTVFPYLAEPHGP